MENGRLLVQKLLVYVLVEQNLQILRIVLAVTLRPYRLTHINVMVLHFIAFVVTVVLDLLTHDV